MIMHNSSTGCNPKNTFFTTFFAGRKSESQKLF